MQLQEGITGIPPEIGNLAGLESLFLEGEDFSGPLPGTIGNLSALQTLRIQQAHGLTGGIPAELGNLSNLTFLEIVSNGLTGTVPAELGNLSNLFTLRLLLPDVAGPLPSTLFTEAENLTFLQVSIKPDVAWQLPEDIGTLKPWRRLDIRNAGLTGELPTSLSAATSLTNLYLDNNNFTGRIPPELSQLTNVANLSFANNQLEGPVPLEFATTCAGMRYCFLRQQGGDLCMPDTPPYRALARSNQIGNMLLNTNCHPVTGTSAEEGGPELAFAVEAPYPNPVQGSLRLGYTLPRAAAVSVVVYDVLGRRVAMAQYPLLPAGQHETVVATGSLASGMYTYEVSTQGLRQSGSFTVVR